MLDKPYDLAVMFGLAAIVIIGLGFGLTDVQNAGVDQNSGFFNNITVLYDSDTGLRGTGGDVMESLKEGENEEQSESSFLVRAGRGLLKLGQSFKTFEKAASDAGGSLGVPVEFIGIISSVLIIVFGVLIYTWWRGK